MPLVTEAAETWTNLPPNSVLAFLYQRVAKPCAPQPAVNLIL